MLRKESNAINRDTERLQLFYQHAPIINCFIQHGVNIDQLANVDIDFLKTCCLFSESEINKIFLIIKPENFFMAHNIKNFQLLLEHGLKIEYLKNQQYSILKNCLDHQHLKDILTFVSLEQILGTNSIPLPLNELLKNYGNNLTQSSNTINHFGKGKVDDFSFEYSKQDVHVIEYKHNHQEAFFNLTSGHSIKQKLTNENAKLIELVHDWYIIEEILEDDLSLKKNIVYSPDLNYVMIEIYSLNFSKEKLEDSLILCLSPYYQEKMFCDFISKKDYSIETLKRIPGMTNTKLTLLCQYQDIIADFMQYQVNLIDFSLASEIRLQCILKHYDKAKYALSVVSAKNLLGLPDKVPYSFSLFPPAKQNQIEKEADPSPSGCHIN